MQKHPRKDGLGQMPLPSFVHFRLVIGVRDTCSKLSVTINHSVYFTTFTRQLLTSQKSEAPRQNGNIETSR